MRARDGHDVTDLVDTEQGGNARHKIFTESRRWTEYVAVTVGERNDLRRQYRCKLVFISRVANGDDTSHGVQPGGLSGDFRWRFRSCRSRL